MCKMECVVYNWRMIKIIVKIGVKIEVRMMLEVMFFGFLVLFGMLMLNILKDLVVCCVCFGGV